MWLKLGDALRFERGTSMINFIASPLLFGLALYAGFTLPPNSIHGMQTSGTQEEALLLAEDIL